MLYYFSNFEPSLILLLLKSDRDESHAWFCCIPSWENINYQITYKKNPHTKGKNKKYIKKSDLLIGDELFYFLN